MHYSARTNATSVNALQLIDKSNGLADYMHSATRIGSLRHTDPRFLRALRNSMPAAFDSWWQKIEQRAS